MQCGIPKQNWDFNRYLGGIFSSYVLISVSISDDFPFFFSNLFFTDVAL